MLKSSELDIVEENDIDIKLLDPARVSIYKADDVGGLAFDVGGAIDGTIGYSIYAWLMPSQVLADLKLEYTSEDKSHYKLYIY